MELRDYFKIIQKSWLSIVAITMVLGIVGYFLAKNQKPSYQATTTFSITLKPQPTSPSVYNFDNYYSLQAATFLLEQVSGFVNSPSTVVDVYNKSQIPVPETDVRKLAKTFTIIKGPADGNSFTVYVVDSDQNKSQKLIDNLSEIVKSDIKNLQTGNNLSNNFMVSSSGTKVVKIPVNIPLKSAVFTISGFILAIAFALIQDYLKRN